MQLPSRNSVPLRGGGRLTFGAGLVNENQSVPLFACQNLSLDLGGRMILRNIDLQLDAGEVLGIIGPNGAGKTSLTEILSGRYTPKTGSVFYKGNDITRLHFYERAKIGIGRTYQTPVVPEDLTVGQTFKAARQAYTPYLTRFDAEYAASLVNFVVDEGVATSSLETFNRRKLLLANILMKKILSCF